MSTAFAIWNGGKDSHYALYQARQAGLECALLLTFIDEETELVMSYRIPPELIEEQAKLVGIPLLKVRVTRPTYERELRNVLFDIRSSGITRGIFGDVRGREQREWFESIVGGFDMRGVFPLGSMPAHLLIEEQRRLMRSTIIQIDRKLSESYLGREVDHEFIEYLFENGLDPTGANGEYQTFVCASPLMHGRIYLTHADRRRTPTTVGLEIDYWKVEKNEA